jgi:TetR/AcrR family transcriptional regulator, transcriptional repressor for nem operon
VPSAASGDRTREALLEAGVAVAEANGLAGLRVNEVVSEAGVAKGTFYVHFSDRDAFVDALHARFYAQVGAAVEDAVAGLEPGSERLQRGLETYLDACLSSRGVKALLVEARADGTLTESMAERSARFSRLAEPSLRAMGWKDPALVARLLLVATSEAALAELEAGRRLPAARGALMRLASTG